VTRTEKILKNAKYEKRSVRGLKMAPKKVTKCKIGLLIKKGICIKAPEIITGKESRFFKQVDFSEDSYAKEYSKARKYVKKNGGEVYTMVDGYGTTVDFFRGVHNFDRLGVVVLK